MKRFFNRCIYHLDHSTNLAVMSVCFIIAVLSLVSSVAYTSITLEENRISMDRELEQFEDHMTWFMFTSPYSAK